MSPNERFEPDTKPRGIYKSAFPEVHWPRVLVGLSAARLGSGHGKYLVSDRIVLIWPPEIGL